ncbi:hypothetical protein F5X68DRAFT_265816 [Plectosphaerella plurivora]|uniref:Rhodopsin domain-containing protein n=1 Tax=Plectosphaerella plurivora TaxID=936078 RepID=A0A9P8V1F5_9PEZI|nr:hypothetical protein F5X68DRAFT_265816 [Plectosphaerella plurivora]
MIALRVVGRFIRSERLFREDKVAALALIPMYMRMACLHVVLLWGTNNANFDGVTLSPEDIRHREIASGLVLATRIFYAATLWILKVAVLEYFQRLTESTGERYVGRTLIFIRVMLASTFFAIVTSTFAECRPIAHYWQVLPDPGGQCRQAYAQFLTMATCNIITDLMLVFFPIPMILRSNLGTKKKFQLTLLFSLSLGVVAVTCYRIPHVIRQQGNQQLRSLLASVELLFAVTAANSLVLGSFVRDRGVKKSKFKFGSVAADSVDRTLISRSRRPTMQRHWGSDEDLVRDVGLGVEPELRDIPEYSDDESGRGYMPAPLVKKFGEDLKQWNFPERQRSRAERSERSDDSLLPHDAMYKTRSNSSTTPRRVSFFDVGGLLSDDQGSGSSRRRDSYLSGVDPLSPVSQDLPSPALPASATGQRRGSTTLLQDIGGFIGPPGPRANRPRPSNGTELHTIPQSRLMRNAIFDPSVNDGPELNDVGGLLR